MSINKRQFDQLSEMGISLWQRRDSRDNSEKNITVNLEQKHAQVLPINTLIKSQCFNDILIAFNLTVGEITTEADHLDLGLINWYFTENDEQSNTTISLVNNTLTTPSIELITQSVTLKKQLWQLISQQ